MNSNKVVSLAVAIAAACVCPSCGHSPNLFTERFGVACPTSETAKRAVRPVVIKKLFDLHSKCLASGQKYDALRKKIESAPSSTTAEEVGRLADLLAELDRAQDENRNLHSQFSGVCFAARGRDDCGNLIGADFAYEADAAECPTYYYDCGGEGF